MLGFDVNCKNCSFAICDGHDSCTKETTYAVGQWLGEGEMFTIVDTPGFGDSDNDDNILIDEMMDVLKSVIKEGFVDISCEPAIVMVRWHKNKNHFNSNLAVIQAVYHGG